MYSAVKSELEISTLHRYITPPLGTGSQYFNYKNTFSIIMLAIAGPDYECLYADIGSDGRTNDSDVWNNSEICNRIEKRELGLPYYFIAPWLD